MMQCDWSERDGHVFVNALQIASSPCAGMGDGLMVRRPDARQSDVGKQGTVGSNLRLRVQRQGKECAV